MQGQLVLDYWAAHPEADKNGDGIVQYVMLSGPADHQDAQIRTVESIKFINDAGVQTEELQREIGDWNRALAIEQMGADFRRQSLQFGIAGHSGRLSPLTAIVKLGMCGLARRFFWHSKCARNAAGRTTAARRNFG